MLLLFELCVVIGLGPKCFTFALIILTYAEKILDFRDFENDFDDVGFRINHCK